MKECKFEDGTVIYLIKNEEEFPEGGEGLLFIQGLPGGACPQILTQVKVNATFSVQDLSTEISKVEGMPAVDR